MWTSPLDLWYYDYSTNKCAPFDQFDGLTSSELTYDTCQAPYYNKTCKGVGIDEQHWFAGCANQNDFYTQIYTDADCRNNVSVNYCGNVN